MNANVEKSLDLARSVVATQRLQHHQKQHVCAHAQRRPDGLVGHHASVCPQAALHRHCLVSKCIGRRCHHGQHHVPWTLNVLKHKVPLHIRITQQFFRRNVGKKSRSASLQVSSSHDHMNGGVPQAV